MNDRDFIYWLQGFFELANCFELNSDLTNSQIKMIYDHIELTRSKRTDLNDFSLIVEWISGKLENHDGLSVNLRKAAVRSIILKVSGVLNKMTPPMGSGTNPLADNMQYSIFPPEHAKSPIYSDVPYGPSIGLTCSLVPAVSDWDPICLPHQEQQVSCSLVSAPSIYEYPTGKGIMSCCLAPRYCSKIGY